MPSLLQYLPILPVGGILVEERLSSSVPSGAIQGMQLRSQNLGMLKLQITLNSHGPKPGRFHPLQNSPLHNESGKFRRQPRTSKLNISDMCPTIPAVSPVEYSTSMYCMRLRQVEWSGVEWVVCKAVRAECSDPRTRIDSTLAANVTSPSQRHQARDRSWRLCSFGIFRDLTSENLTPNQLEYISRVRQSNSYTDA